MSAETLRRASAKMRERAEAATNLPWMADGHAVLLTGFDPCDPEPCECDPVAAEVLRDAHAEHIASWHPAVALAGARLLEDEADAIEMQQAITPGYQPGPNDASVAFARAYLGESDG